MSFPAAVEQHIEDNMKIGVIASIAHRLPPSGYSPWGQVAAALTDGFVAAGHTVTLFASADSTTAAWLNATAAAGYEEDKRLDARVCESQHLAAAFERAVGFDLLLNQSDFLPLGYSRLVSTPMVTTVRGFSSAQVVPVYRAYDDVAHYVAVSAASRNAALHYDATIHPGIDTSRFTDQPGPGEYLLFLGPIRSDKGTDLAIEVAKKAGLPLIIAGAVQDKSYFRDAVEPHVDGVGVSYLGAVEPVERNTLLGGAKALLHLIGVAEPFSFTAIEALATGTPVIATPLGSMPEVVRDGTTGLLVSDAAAAVAAVAKLDGLDRAACRQDAVSRFGTDRMVADYLALFDEILGVKTPRHPGSPQSIGSPGLFSHAGPPPGS
jgi:glycosyltransferase involved in cell wall biosynthesis